MSSGNRRLRVLTAFSRDQPHKIYVQKVLGEADDSCLICQHILKRNGAVYIAGGPQMARWVKQEIVSSLGKELGSEKRASQFLVQLQRSGKFSVEAWSWVEHQSYSGKDADLRGYDEHIFHLTAELQPFLPKNKS